MSLIISVKDALRNEGERYDISLDAAIEPTDYMGKVSFENVKIEGFYFADGKQIRTCGKANLRCIFECDRCLKEFAKDYSLSFNEIFSFDAEEELFRISRNESVDFQPLLNDTVFSSLPIERLCREDCKGLCPHCGIDKNFSSCTCEDDYSDSPFAILKGLED